MFRVHDDERLRRPSRIAGRITTVAVGPPLLPLRNLRSRLNDECPCRTDSRRAMPRTLSSHLSTEFLPAAPVRLVRTAAEDGPRE